MYSLGIDFTEWTTERLFKLGTKIFAENDYGSACYQYVRLRNESATVAGVAGDPVAYIGAPDVSSNNDEINTIVIDVTDAAAVPVCAGVLAGAVAGVAATEYYGWVQQTGFVITTVTIAGTPADGDALFLSITDKTFQKCTTADHIQCADGVDVSEKMVRLRCA